MNINYILSLAYIDVIVLCNVLDAREFGVTGVESDKLQPNPQPSIPTFPPKLQRVQVLQYKYLVAAKCTSQQSQKVSENAM